LAISRDTFTTIGTGGAPIEVAAHDGFDGVPLTDIDYVGIGAEDIVERRTGRIGYLRGMDVSVVVRAREAGTSTEAILGLASMADHLGYKELWVGEGPRWDAFVLAAGVGMSTESASLSVGPVPVSVRDPATIVRGAVSVAALTGRRVGMALGTASVRVVEQLHRRSRARPVTDLTDSAKSIRRLIDTPPEERWAGEADAEFLRSLGALDGPLTVAAFGNRAIQVAAEYADRMLLDLVTPEQVKILRTKLEAVASNRPVPKMAAWLPVAVEPTGEAILDLKKSIADYLTIGGYKEMFIDAGFENAVADAELGMSVCQLAYSIPSGLAESVGLIGDSLDIGRRLHAYAEAGLDEVAAVPMMAGDIRGERSLRALRSLF
jgi:probable F420-dependent oxidoreductase